MPFLYYKPYNKNSLFYNRPVRQYSNYIYNIPQHQKNCTQDTNNIKNNNSNQIQKQAISSKNEDVWLELFGIQLYFDDILILSLLFFLYNEDVKDEGLFLALILLLIS